MLDSWVPQEGLLAVFEAICISPCTPDKPKLIEGVVATEHVDHVRDAADVLGSDVLIERRSTLTHTVHGGVLYPPVATIR